MLKLVICLRFKIGQDVPERPNRPKYCVIFCVIDCVIVLFSWRMKTKPTSSGSPTKPHRVLAPRGYDNQPKRKAYYFRTKSEADDFATTVNRWKANQTAPVDGTIQIDQAELKWLAFLRQELKELSLLPEVIRFWKKNGAGAVEATGVVDAIIAYLAWREPRTDNQRTMSDVRWRLKDFGGAFSDRLVHEITPKQITDYLDGKEDGWSRKSFWKRVSQFFGWCESERLVAINPCQHLKAPEVRYLAPAIYSVEDVASVLETAEKGFPALFPYLVLSLFGFVRTSELVRMYPEEKILNWADIEFDQRLIHVKPGVAKGTRRKAGDERFIKMNDCLIHFLKPYAKSAGSVCELPHNTFYNQLNLLFEKAEVEQIPNALRHSCLSYAIAANPENGVALVAQWAGNSESVSRRHYIKNLRPEEGQRYFGLRRA
jgi:integrase